MKVEPISFGNLKVNNNLQKNGNNKEKTENYAQNPLVALKSIPLATLIAFSPLNVSAANENSNLPEVVKTEQTDSLDVKPSVVGKKEITTSDGNEFCRFIAYNTDKATQDAELMGFNYNCYAKNGDIGVLKGVFQAICPDKVDGKYLVTYEKIGDDNDSGVVKGCLLSEEFGNYLLKFANSRYNNGAIDIVSKDNLEKSFGKIFQELKDDVTEFYAP